VTKAVPGEDLLMAQPIEMRFNELMEGVRADIAVKIFADDYDWLEKTAGQIKEILEKIRGAAEVAFEASGRVPMLKAQVNRAALARHNLHAAEMNKAISTALGGQVVGAIVEGNRRFEIVVAMDEHEEKDDRKFRHLPVEAP